MRFTIFFFFATTFLSTSCTKEHDITDIEEESFVPITNVEVQSLVISIGEDIPFTCKINEQEYSSLGEGILLLKNVLLEKNGNAVLIQSDGYFDEIRYVIPTLGANLHLELDLTKIILEGGFGSELEGFNAKDGGTISGFRTNIVLEPNSIVDADGNLYEGDVRVFATNTFNAAYVNNITKFPQNYYTENGINKTLNIGGGLNLVLLDDLDKRLYLKNGVTADISFEVIGAVQLGIPNLMEMMYYDIENDEWITMGTVEKEGETWYGTLNNLGIIAWGTPYTSRVAQIKLFTDEGHIVPNKFVFLFTELETPHAIAFSNNEGIAKLHVPIGVKFRLKTIELHSTSTITTQEYSMIGSGQEDVLTLEDFVLNSEAYQIYNGNIIDCDDNIITESAIVMNVNTNYLNGLNYRTYFFSDNEGEFNFARRTAKVNPIKIRAFDLNSGLISEENDFFNDKEEIVNFESLILCE